MLTGNKDVDRKILNELEDKDLVNVCQTNKKANSLCNDQVFWMNRVFDRFGYVGGNILRKYKGTDRSWSEYYINDLRKINLTNAQNYLNRGSIKDRLDHVVIALNFPNSITNLIYPMKMVSAYGNLDILKYLVSHGVDIQVDNNVALRLASRKGNLDVVKYLLDNGADIHAGDDYALEFAVSAGHLDVVKYLVSQGADIKAYIDPISTFSRGQYETVQYMKSLNNL